MVSSNIIIYVNWTNVPRTFCRKTNLVPRALFPGFGDEVVAKRHLKLVKPFSSFFWSGPFSEFSEGKGGVGW